MYSTLEGKVPDFYNGHPGRQQNLLSSLVYAQLYGV